MAQDDYAQLDLAPAPGGGTLLGVKVVPGASRDRVVGPLGARLKVTTSRRPEKGAANKAVAACLARTLGLKSADVELTAGAARPEKTFLVRGLDTDELRRRLSQA